MESHINPKEDPLVALLEELSECNKKRRRELARRFLYTLNANKIEAEHQRKGEYLIFDRSYDQFGLLTKAKVRPEYRESVEPPRTRFTKDKIYNALETIMSAFKSENETLRGHLSLTLGINRIQAVAQAKEVLVKVTYNEDGYVTGCWSEQEE